MTPAVSIIVPTLNAMASLPALLDAIDRQDDGAPREVVVVDSGSTDGTGEYVMSRLGRMIQVDRFNHGTTRNTGVEESRAPLVVLTVQDALPVGRDWLQQLLCPLRADARVAGVFARQIPRPDASPVIRHGLNQWVAARPEARVVELTPTEFQALAPMRRLDRCAFDNVCSAIRREVWQRHPFAATPIAEDLEWSRDVLLAGYRIAYQPSSVVEHSHDRPARYELARTWALHQRLHHLFGVRTIASLPALLHSLGSTAACHRRLLREAGITTGQRGWLRATALGIAWPLGQFVGGWTAAHGRDRWRPGGV